MKPAASTHPETTRSSVADTGELSKVEAHWSHASINRSAAAATGKEASITKLK